MTGVITIEIPGYCQPKQRTFGNRFATPPETRAYEKLVRHYALLAMRGRPVLQEFIGIEIAITHVVPPSWSKKKRAAALSGQLFPTHCDLDNQIKALCDGMNRSVYTDDRLINRLSVRRDYGTADKATVLVRKLITS